MPKDISPSPKKVSHMDIPSSPKNISPRTGAGAGGYLGGVIVVVSEVGFGWLVFGCYSKVPGG